MIQPTQENRQLRIDTPLGNDVLMLQSFRGTEALSKDFSYEAAVLSKEPAVDGNQIVGKRITVTYFDEDGRKRRFNGFVSRFEYAGQVEEPAKLTAYKLEMVPWLWFLKHNTDCQIFQEMTTPEIITQILQELGFNDFRQELTESYPVREYCVQYRETDYNFVTRLMEEEGIFFYFEHTASKHTLVMCDSTAGYFDLNETEVRYSEVAQTHFRQLSGWRHVYEFRPGKVAQKDFNFKQPTDALVTDQTSRIKFEGSSSLEVYEYPGLYDESGKGDRLTKVRLEELEARHDRVEGSGYYLTFTPGGKFDVEDHSNPAERGRSWAITEVYTEIHSNLGYDSYTGEDFHNEFVCIPADTPFRPARESTKPIVEGPQTAIVVTDGQEVVVDEHARVKVQFHWDRYGQKDVNSSCWIRVSQVHAGKGWGMIDIPRQHEEVIVSFLDGDPDRPIITGRVYNGDNIAPFGLKGAGANAKNKTRRGNTTKTYEGTGYNEMTMDDTNGQEQIRIHAQYNMDSVVEHDQTLHVMNNRTKTIDVDETNTIGNNRTTTVGVNHTETVGSNQTIMVGANQTITVGANQTNTIGAAQTTLVAAAQTNLVGGAQSNVIGGAYALAVGAGSGVAVGGAAGQLVGASNQVQVVGSSKTVVGGKTEIVSGDEIALKCGASEILMKKDGTIKIKGTDVLMQAAGGKVHIKDGGIITIKGPMVKINT